MAAGLPVLTTVDTEAADLVKRYRVGEAVTFDVVALSDAIIEILKDTEKYRQYSENAKTFSTMYDWEKLIEKYYLLIKYHYEFCFKNKEGF